MKQRFEDVLQEAMGLVEAGHDVEAVAARYPEHSDRLRAPLQLVARLHSAREEEPGPREISAARARFRAELNNHLAGQGGENRMGRDALGWTLKLTGAVAAAAALFIGVALATDNLHVEWGSDGAEAQATHPCLDEVLGNLDPEQDGTFDFNDLLAFRDAVRDQNTDPRYDRDGDGDVDIDDVMVYIDELRTCFSESFPQPPNG